MLKWHERLFVSQTVASRQEEIQNKLNRGIPVPGIYLITLASNSSDLLDLVPELMLQQCRIREHLPVIIGIAMGRSEAVHLACRIVYEGYKNSGDFRAIPGETFSGKT